MGFWNWDDIPCEEGPVLQGPVEARLAASIVPPWHLNQEYELSVAQKTGLPTLPLVEWSISHEVPRIFDLLSQSGSKTGYVVKQAEGYVADVTFKMIDIDERTGQAICRDAAMDMPMAFVDDQGHCALASYHSDYALIALTHDLFAEWLTERPLDLTLWASDEPWPPACDLAQAQLLATRRRHAWDEHVQLFKGS